MKVPPQGTSLRLRFDVTSDDTAAAIGNPGVEVISTVTLIKLIEDACYQVVAPAYEEGDATVGIKVAVDHLAPARPGRPVEILATLARVKGRRLCFEVEVDQDGVRVMQGEHHRAAVKLDTFLGPGGERSESAGGGPKVEFWYDVHSPWCYFASYRIGGIVRAHGGEVVWRPVHLPNLIELIGGRRPLEGIASFVRWFQQDIRDHAELHGLPYDPHKDYPLRPSRALRAGLYAQDQGAAEPFVQAMMRAYWSQQADISDPGVLQRLGVQAGLDPEGVAAATADDAYKARVAANLQEAADRGIFGLPAMFLDGKLFWGNDRLDLLDRWLGRFQQ